MERLQQLLNNLHLIQATHPEDACIVLADTEKVIGYVPGKTIDLRIPLGATIDNFKGTVTHNALETGEPQKEERGSEGFGVAYISNATPIIENNQVVGVISAIVSNNKVDTIRKGAHKLTSISQELSSSSDEMMDVSEIVSKDLHELSEESILLQKEIKQIEEILAIIKNTASKSRILGLNASIEAARSGEQGKGFEVVAKEIKKLADNSKKTVEGVEPQLKEMMVNLEKIIATIQHISSHSQKQTRVMGELHDAFEQIVSTARELKEQEY